MDGFLKVVAARLRKLIPERRRLVVLGSIVGGFFLLFVMAHKHGAFPVMHHLENYGRPNQAPWHPDGLPSATEFERQQKMINLATSPMANGALGTDYAHQEPRIAYSAELEVATKEFLRSRAKLEEILERHRGYVAKLRMVGQPTGSELSATLRVPSSEYDAALSDFKSIGRIEKDEESADELTEQHGALEARLLNARNAERRLQQLLKDYAGKNEGLASIERQLTLIRQEIERLEAERTSIDSRTIFSSVLFTMREQIPTPTESFSAQFRSAATSGLTDALHTLSSIFMFVFGYGPTLLLWIVILFLPLRFVWRRTRGSLLRETS